MLENDDVIVGVKLSDIKVEIPTKNDDHGITTIKKLHPVRNHSSAIQAFISTNLNYRANNQQHHYFGTIKGID